MPERISKMTIDHDEIRRWAEQRRARPAIVRGTGIIRLAFPGVTGVEQLQVVSWDAWFRRFDETKLAFVYEVSTSRGQRSSFNKLVERETVDLKAGRLRALPRRRAAQGARPMKEARRLRVSKTRAVARKSQPKKRAAAKLARTPAKSPRRAGTRAARAKARLRVRRAGRRARS
jgi:hypothetical protein